MDGHEFSISDLRMLVEQERAMDRGEIPYVYVQGSTQRASMRPEIMESLGLEVGQTITPLIFTEILRLNIAHCEQEMAYRRFVEEQEREEREGSAATEGSA